MLADSTKNSGSTIFCRVKLLIEYYMFFTAANADSLFAFTALWAKALFCCSKSLGFCKISFKQLLYCRKDTPWCFAVCKTILQGVRLKCLPCKIFYGIQATIFHHCYETCILGLQCKAMLYLPSDIYRATCNFFTNFQ